MELKLLGAPNWDNEPVSVDDAKAYLRVTHSFEDALLEDLCVAARELCERAARISIAKQTWVVTYRLPKVKALAFGLDYSIYDPENIATKLALPKTPIVSVEEINIVKYNGEKTALTLVDEDGVGDYRFDTMADTILWNTQLFLQDPEYSYLEVQFTSGFEKDKINKDIKTAILIVVADLYENRGSERDSIPNKSLILLTGYRSQRTL